MDGITSIDIQIIDFSPFTGQNLTLRIARLDKIHPVISGNKLFKLHYFLEESESLGIKKVITAGGAYSNHLVAAAFACKQRGLQSIGIVRGEEPPLLSPTLKDCLKYGMELQFMPREEFDRMQEKWEAENSNRTQEFDMFIPHGGFHHLGAKGASLIAELLNQIPYTHVCMPVGTGTTLAGMAASIHSQQKKIIGIPVLKGLADIEERFSRLQVKFDTSRVIISDDYHFGGYARKSNELIEFMNDFFERTGIPTDFVYTGKMMFAVMDMIRNGFFPSGSDIICLHTGGLQGNRSLPPGSLSYSR